MHPTWFHILFMRALLPHSSFQAIKVSSVLFVIVCCEHARESKSKGCMNLMTINSAEPTSYEDTRNFQ